MKYSLKYIIYAMVLMLAVSNHACSPDTMLTPSVTTIISEDNKIAANQGMPGDMVRVDGADLAGIKSITIKAKNVPDAQEINVVFNPALNSNKAVFFTLPFDDAKSVFGMQVVTLTNNDGNSISWDFEILQPKPAIINFNPERPKAKQKVVITGNWLQNLISVKFQNKLVTFEQTSSKSISFIVPDGTVAGDSVVITTPGGRIAKFLDIDLGYNVYKYMNFDGGGMYTSNSWRNNGDITTPVVFSNVNGIDGNYVEVSWVGSSSNGWGNAEPTSGAKPGIAETDQSKVFLVFDAYCVSVEGTSMQIQIDDGTTVWAHDHTFTADEVGKWVSVKMSAYNFGAGYNPGNQTHDMDIKNISYMKIGINQWTGKVPSTVRVDNIRFFGYY